MIVLLNEAGVCTTVLPPVTPCEAEDPDVMLSRTTGFNEVTFLEFLLNVSKLFPNEFFTNNSLPKKEYE